MIDAFFQPWPWYIGGSLIALVMFLLVFMGEKFGLSSNLRALCSIGGAGNKFAFFDYDWKASSWNLFFALGTIIGGFVAAHFLSANIAIDLEPSVIADLHQKGFPSAGKAYAPLSLFTASVFSDFGSLAMLIIGGFFVGFGARYAGGCTSGHAIMGLSTLQLPSLIAVIGFFVGGLVMIHILFPIIFGQ